LHTFRHLGKHILMTKWKFLKQSPITSICLLSSSVIYFRYLYILYSWLPFHLCTGYALHQMICPVQTLFNYALWSKINSFQKKLQNLDSVCLAPECIECLILFAYLFVFNLRAGKYIQKTRKIYATEYQLCIGRLKPGYE